MQIVSIGHSNIDDVNKNEVNSDDNSNISFKCKNIHNSSGEPYHWNPWQNQRIQRIQPGQHFLCCNGEHEANDFTKSTLYFIHICIGAME